MKTYTSNEAKQQFGGFIEDGQRDIVQLTRNGRAIGGFVNQARLNRLIEIERKEAQRRILGAIKELSKDAGTKPKPTRADLREALECDDDELDNLFDEDFL